ncbi:MAG TPA: SUF system NifU family Fe-S cluster assembly protein [Candidatus Thermoplasmatota archaeon]|nr:SUF system NifU family Fe-S cluster assembly protein [Candidatus Thermoplasmatota archaeon]
MTTDEPQPNAGSAEAMYRDHILEHYRKPRNFGVLKDAHIDHREDNPLCGDDIRITMKLAPDNTVSEVKFQGRGCAISQASASLLTTKVKGMPIDQVKQLTRDDVVAMLGIPVSPVRLKCAILSLAVTRNGIDLYEKKLNPSS